MNRYRIHFSNEDRRPITLQADRVDEADGRYVFYNQEDKIVASFINITFYQLNAGEDEGDVD